MSLTPKVANTQDSLTLTARQVAPVPVDDVLRWLDSSVAGLSSAEASARLVRYGPNAVRTHHVNALAVLGRQLRNAVLILLAGTAVVSFFLGDSMQAIIIGVILAASIGLGFVNEYRAERAAAELHGRVHHKALVRHDGEFVTVEVTDLVPGDVIRLSLGEAGRCPADRGQRSGMQRRHPDRRIDRRGEIATAGARRYRTGRVNRPGVHGHHRQRRRGHRSGVWHRPKCRIRKDRCGFG